MEQNNAPVITQDEDFKKRRNQKNWIVMGLIMGCVGLIWAVTMLKMQSGASMAYSETSAESSKANEGDTHAQ